MFRTIFMTAAILAAISAETEAISLSKIQAETISNELAQTQMYEQWYRTIPQEESKPKVRKPKVSKPEVKKPEVKKPEVSKPEDSKPEGFFDGVQRFFGLLPEPVKKEIEQKKNYQDNYDVIHMTGRGLDSDYHWGLREAQNAAKKKVDAPVNEKKENATPVVEEKGDATSVDEIKGDATTVVTDEKIVEPPVVTDEKKVDTPVATEEKENVVEKKDDAKLAPGDLAAANKQQKTKMNTYSKLDTDFPAGNPKGAIDALNAKNETFKINIHGKQTQ